MTVLGIDISKWDGSWNAAITKQAGCAFVFIKASQATFTDPRFKENWVKAKSAGLLRGAYHYLDYSKAAKDQANYFCNLLETDPGELPLVVDYEEKRSDNNFDVARSYLRGFLDQLLARQVTPMIYISRGFWNAYGDSSDYWLQFPLWLANWTVTESPPLPAPWKKWDFWQYTADGSGDKYGTEGARVDLNYYYGSLSQLNQFASANKPVIGPEPPTANQEERISTLEFMLADLEPIFTEAVSGLDKRIVSLEVNGTTGQADSSALASVSQRFSTIEQQLSTMSQQNSSVSQQVSSVNQQVNAIKQQMNSISQPDLTPMDNLAQRVSSIEKKLELINQAPSQPAQNPSPSPSPSSSSTYAICNVQGLNVRSGPGLEYPVLTGIFYGQRVKVLSSQNGWAQIENPEGWSAEIYLNYV